MQFVFQQPLFAQNKRPYAVTIMLYISLFWTVIKLYDIWSFVTGFFGVVTVKSKETVS